MKHRSAMWKDYAVAFYCLTTVDVQRKMEIKEKMKKKPFYDVFFPVSIPNFIVLSNEKARYKLNNKYKTTRNCMLQDIKLLRSCK